ncbi:hypothetical protein [Kineosporia sp. NBRC 101731]|uniref:hypothetical protein n=1 Tax=Kineosporia sp. NBRC 101731 TaxID=3032199 RepID=UPI0025567DE4|nr:hypothetical protein [Kineosporia sp. NBRC 101731]
MPIGRVLAQHLAAFVMTRMYLVRGRGGDRGDVPGWVLVTLMTAGLVVALWGAAGPRLVQVFNDAVDNVVGGP